MVRAVMARLIEWARDGRLPPASRYPVPGGGLVPPDRTAMGFPDLSSLGVGFPGVINTLTMVDAAAVPPRADPARAYRVQVPRTDGDGHDIDAVRLPDVAVPLATYSGWNLRRAGFAEGNLCGLNGISVPLSQTVADRAARRDPRASIAERYPNRSAYVQRVQASAEALRNAGFLLDEDMQRWIAQARSEPRAAFLPP